VATGAVAETAEAVNGETGGIDGIVIEALRATL